MAQNTTSTSPLPSTSLAPNGVVTAASPRGQVGGNRKKQKRRAKEAAKKAARHQHPHSHAPQTPQQDYSHDHDADSDLQDDQQDDYYSEDEDYDEDDDYPATAAAVSAPNPSSHHHYTPDPASLPTPSTAAKRKHKKKRRSTSAQQPMYSDPASLISSAMGSMPLPTPPPPPPPMSGAAFRSVQRGAKQDRIWNTSTQEERERIKEFWLSLSEEERKSLLKIEKEAVLRKMKEQQKHSCSCTVCGRKRTAIEEELEVLYDAYYEELEQYAHQKGDPSDGMLPPLRAPSRPSPHHHHHHHHHHHTGIPPPLNPANSHHRTSRVHEIIDSADEDLSEDDEEEYSDEDDEEEDEDEDDEDEYSDEGEDEPDDDMPRGIGADFFNFGNSLTVKGGILTVADDLLKNDGKKFIEMMEQLAERRMQREQEAEYAASQPPHTYPPSAHEPPLEDEEYEEDDEEYDSQEDYDEEEEEDDMGGMTEEQRMEEGRRMFQIFAARMFEQRVLTAYREKVAAERQQRLLEELEDESRLDAEREAKKARDAEKRKKKKDAQKQAKAEEKARRDAEKAAEESALKEIEEKKREDQLRKKEEQRKKKEAERKALEEEKQRKEAERLKRQQEERERQQETERKLREQKALEKKQREEARKKEREEREAREREAKEKKAQDEREKRERESKAKAEREALDRERRQQHAASHHPQVAKRPSQVGMVAVPPTLHSKQSNSGVNSPHVAVATPAMPKLPMPGHPRQNSFYGSHATSPKSSQPSTSKSTSPGSVNGFPPNTAPKTILQKPQNQPPMMHHPQPTSPMNQLPPPGMPYPHTNPFGGLSQMGTFPSFNQPHGPFMNHRQSLPGFPASPQQGNPFQSFHGANAMSGVPPPGMNGLGMMPQGRGFSMDGSSAFSQQMPPMGVPSTPGFGMPRHSTAATHSRTHSSDKSSVDPAILTASTQPIARPTPIQRPLSVKPQEGRPGKGDVDDLSKHLGSSALLDDADEPLPVASERRQSAFAGPRGSGPIGIGSPFAGSARIESLGTPGSSWTSPSMFGPPGLMSSSSWGATVNPISWNSGFGSLGHRPSGPNRPLTIRLALCQACKQLDACEPTNDDYHPVDSLLRQIDTNRPLVDSPITLKEIEDICETEGDAHNGGGLLHVRHENINFSVKFEPDAATPNTGRPPAGLGEIGSPMPRHPVPAFGTSAPNKIGGFGSLSAAVNSPGGRDFS